MYRSTIAHYVPIQFRYIPIIISACIAVPAFMDLPDSLNRFGFAFIIFFFIGIFFMTYHKGLLLNAKIFEYKIYSGLFGIRSGKWKPLSNIKQIYVYRSSSSTDASFGVFFSYGSIKSTSVYVVLLTENGQKIPVASASGKKEALKIAKDLNKYLSTTICDHTGRERVYLTENE